MSGFSDAGAADLAPGTCALRLVEGRAVLVARAGDGRLFALDGHCSHLNRPMEGATLRAASVLCPHHGARFCLETGRALHPPAAGPIATFPAREAGGRVQVMLP